MLINLFLVNFSKIQTIKMQRGKCIVQFAYEGNKFGTIK